MYKELVSTLSIDLINIELWQIYDEQKLENLRVDDVLFPIDKSNNPYLPDFGISGFFEHKNHHQINQFYIDPLGPYILYVTGVPKEDHDKFRIITQEVVFRTYWEDKFIGYMTQIVKKPFKNQ